MKNQEDNSGKRDNRADEKEKKVSAEGIIPEDVTPGEVKRKVAPGTNNAVRNADNGRLPGDKGSSYQVDEPENMDLNSDLEDEEDVTKSRKK